MKRILVLTEKHGYRYFDASTDKLLAQAALLVLKERQEDGGWYEKPDAEPPPLDFAESDIDKMPASMRDEARTKYKLYRSLCNDYREACDDQARVNHAISTNDGMSAWHILRDRSRYEYERAELENLEDASSVVVLWPPIPNGTRVITTRSHTVRTETEGHVISELLGERKWEVRGEIVGFSEIIGLLYEVRHEDGTHGRYKSCEFRVLPKEKP